MNFTIPSAPLSMALPATGLVGASQNGTVSTLQHNKLTDAAQQFEGMLLQELLKPMREHGFCQDESEDKEEGSGFGDTLSSFGTESVATAIAKGGGLGIAKRVVAQVDSEKASRDSQANMRATKMP